MNDNVFTLRHHSDEDIDWVIQRHGKIYSDEYGWDSRFQDLVALKIAPAALNGS